MGTPAEDNRLLIMDEAMSLLRISRSTMYRLIDRGELQGYKIAKRWLFERKDLEDLIARKRTQTVIATGIASAQDRTRRLSRV